MISAVFELLDLAALAVLIPVVCLSCFIFTTVGFGGGVVAVPVALLFLEPIFVLPVLAVIETFTVLHMMRKHHRSVVRADVMRIIPAAAVGSVAGVWLLVSLPVPWLMLGMSGFIVLFLLTRWMIPQTNTPISNAWALPTGVLAGLCSGAFGAGGPPSAMYFTMRQLSVDQLRSSIAATGSANLFFRILGFAIAGLYVKPTVLVTAVCLLPFAWGSVYIANKVRGELSSRTILWVTYAILVFSALSLAVRSQQLPTVAS